MLTPRLEILPAAQRTLWPLLSKIPTEFILYGGTAVALQLGHRESVDFGFFSDTPLNKNKLLDSLSFLQNTTLVQPEMNTLNVIIELPMGSVKMQFLADLAKRQKRVETPQQCYENNLQIASLRDLLATKLNTIQMRAELKDYVDIHAMLKHGLTLEDGLGCARAIYGKNFDPATSLRALCSYHDGNLLEIESTTKNYLLTAAHNVNDIPEVKI